MKSLFSIVFFLVSILLSSCSQTEDKGKVTSRKTNQKEGECPKGHLDEVIPILYGFPTEESFQKADSGLLYLGGCELPENPPKYYCKKHQIQF